MSLEDTKKHLIAALQDQENRVIALSGKWGTGKSHLWRDVKEDSGDDKIGRAVYVSVFGVSDINQLQLKALRAAVPVAADDSAWAERIRRITRAGTEVLKSVSRAFGALDEIALLVAPQFLRGRIVVLDDIERKHPKLSVDEILGLIDELTQQHDARFVLILNDDKLDEAAKDAWATLREKVIDQEVRLITTPDESFEIARAQTKLPDGYAACTKLAVDTLGVDNVRVIRKIIRNVSRVLAERVLEPQILNRTIPSIALLSAIHYQGMDDPPDFNFVLRAGISDDVRYEIETRDADGKISEIATQRAKWRELLIELGINNCDEFEELVIAFLKDGQFDASGVTKILDRYEREADQLLAQQTGQALSRRLYWDADASEEQLVDDARELIPYARYWDAHLVTNLVNELGELQGGDEVGKAFVQAWIEEFRTREKSGGNYDEDFYQLHPAIVAELKADQAHRAAAESASLLQVVRRIVKQSGWGANEEFAMRKATALDFEATIREANMEDRSFFLRHMIRMRTEWRNYDPHFGNATQRFVDACRAILSAPASDRLAQLIRRVVAGTPIEHEL